MCSFFQCVLEKSNSIVHFPVLAIGAQKYVKENLSF
jgi:hypothetical protein